MRIKLLGAGVDTSKLRDKYKEIIESTPGVTVAAINAFSRDIDAALLLLSPVFFLETACKVQTVEILRKRPDIVARGHLFALVVKECTITLEISGGNTVTFLYGGRTPKGHTQRVAAIREMLASLGSTTPRLPEPKKREL